MTCGKCGAENNDYARYCWNCGTPTHVSKIQRSNLLRFLNYEWLGFSEVVSKLLYIGALCILGFYLFRAIDLLFVGSNITAYLITLSLGLLSIGIFYAGILTGLAGIISKHKYSKQKLGPRKLLYIAAGSLLLVAIVILALYMFRDSDSLDYSIGNRLLSGLSSFAAIGLFQAGVLAGFGALSTPRQQTESQDHNPIINALYVAAAATIIIRIITGSLSVTLTYSDLFSNLDTAAFFLTDFGQYGIFYGGILIALAKMISLRNRNRNVPDSTDEECEENEEEEESSMNGPTTP